MWQKMAGIFYDSYLPILDFNLQLHNYHLNQNYQDPSCGAGQNQDQ